MSINDFDYVDDPIDTVERVAIHLIPAKEKRDQVFDAIEEYADIVGEKWFSLGERLERKRILDLLDKLDQGLLDSEEDAKITIGVIRKMIEDDPSIEEDSGESGKD